MTDQIILQWAETPQQPVVRPPAVAKRLCGHCKGSGNIRTRGRKIAFHACTTCAGKGVRWKADLFPAIEWYR